jgi:transcriptional regulator with XRE-family HTH domain
MPICHFNVNERFGFFGAIGPEAKAIRARRLATQAQIEASTGVDQGTISKALNGKRRRVNERLQILDKYADMLIGKDELPPAVSHAAREFLIFGSEAELVASIEHCARLVSRRLD